MEVCYTYDPLDRIENIQYGNGIKTTYEYDCNGNISQLETKTNDAVLLSFTYQYDGNGNRTAKIGTQGITARNSALQSATMGNIIEESSALQSAVMRNIIEGSSALQPTAMDIRYQYDIRGQLLEERRNGASVHYMYDAAGNRIRKTEEQKETRYHYNQKNQLLKEENAEGINYFTYDKQGGIVKEKTSSGIRKFTYNSIHQQTRIETTDGRIQENRYDAEGLRYDLIENGKRTRFIYHNGELLYEKEETKQSKEETSYQLGAGIEAFQRNSKTFYYHQDEQLNTALITNGNREIKNQYQYDAFGNGLETIEELPNRIRYTGQQYDQQTEQYYLRARYYNPIVGRFMQEDVYQGDGLNLYAYCHNNPVVYFDPSGYACGESGEIAGDGGTEPKGKKISKLSKVVDKIMQKAQKGNLKRSKHYHGRLNDLLEQEIISNPDAVYVTNNNKQNLLFRKVNDVVIVESNGSSQGNLITSYGPSGPRGDSGASIFGGSSSEPGMPITHEDIINGKIKQPGGETFPPATQIR